MTIAALELNDQSLLIQAEDGALHAEPGFARLTPDGIVTGEAARSVAWREPQHVYNQYWCRLNQTALPSRHRFARHHADIAFAQLQGLWQAGGKPESLILLVPGSFTREQLSLLLGMAQALPSRVSAVIDSALAACTDVERDTLYVDLQLHESVFTVCRPHGPAIRIEDQAVFPGLGMSQIQNSMARHISDLVIENYRFDPLHSSTTEQAIFDQLPHWLQRLRWENDVSIKLASEQGEHPCILTRDAIKTLVGERLESARSFMAKWPGCNLALSQSSGLLSGLVDDFTEAEIVNQAAGIQRCLSRHEEIQGQVEGLYRLRELRSTRPETALPAMNGEHQATHVLCGDLALPLSKPVSIRVTEQGLSMSNKLDENAALTVVLRNRSLETLKGTAEIALPPSCRPGESIRIGGHELKLIRVCND